MSDRELEMTRKLTLETATTFVTKDRNKDNGDPEDNFKHIAAEWNVWLEARFPGCGVVLTTVDVAILSMKIKVARLIGNDEKWDNYIDIAGYAACGAECAAVLKYEKEQRCLGIPEVGRTSEDDSDIVVDTSGIPEHLMREDPLLRYVSKIIDEAVLNGI